MSVKLPPLRITDAADFGQVAVLMGGDSSEREVSLMSGQGVLDALQSRGIHAHAVDGIPALVNAISAGRVDRVFNILHGGAGENGVVQGLLEALKLPYTGTGVLGAALTYDKIRTKQVWQAAGLPTPNCVRLKPGDDLKDALHQVGIPAFIKPSCEGSSVGIARILSRDDLPAAQAVMARYGGEMMAEPLIHGDEITVGILNGIALPSIHIVPESGLYDYHAKYIADGTRYLCPGLDTAGEAEAAALSLSAFAAAGCSGWGRVDLMRDRNGKFWLLEINTTPGMTSHSLVPKAAAALGCDYPELCWRILEATLPEAAAC